MSINLSLEELREVGAYFSRSLCAQRELEYSPQSALGNSERNEGDLRAYVVIDGNNGVAAKP